MDLVTPSIGLIFWHTIIFVTLILFLSKFAWKPIMNFIDQREKKISKSLEEADKLKEELKKIDNHKNKILKEACRKRDLILEEAIQIKKEIKSKAKEESLIEKKRIIEETKKVIQTEKEVAIHELKNKISDFSVKIAEKILTRELDKIQKQDKFIRNLIDKL
ncbi:F0F1 ATP synthase subunit B [Blattabacterium cuenoti]|uniref:F0F1 ATP synthase subunit B n=1 Tax=Blattabacterium cuenoti TaxID=1653831 RepID=UPI00163B7CD1|nr:F0F1 ATP synthase subunit B [Blattabacterium cuenoti]